MVRRTIGFFIDGLAVLLGEITMRIAGRSIVTALYRMFLYAIGMSLCKLNPISGEDSG
jgi:hypothetical protein